MATGYEDIDNLMSNQNKMLDNALTQQQDITNKQTALNVAELERNKEDIDRETNKTTANLYTNYKKQANQYGANADILARQGLANSGYSETSQTNLYNTYQKNVTDTLANSQKLKADFDFEINKARQTGDITLAQNALEIYNQKMQLLTQEYELRNNREQYLYQKEQDALTQSNWEKEWARQQERDRVSDSQWQQTFDYQKQRDSVADSQWAKEYALSKKKSTASSSSGSSLNVSDGNSNNSNISATVNKLFDSINSLLSNNSSNINKETARRLIRGEENKGTISSKESSALYQTFGL